MTTFLGEVESLPWTFFHSTVRFGTREDEPVTPGSPDAGTRRSHPLGDLTREARRHSDSIPMQTGWREEPTSRPLGLRSSQECFSLCRRREDLGR